MIVKWFASSGLLNVYGTFAPAAGIVPVESGARLCVLGCACFLIGSVSALWASRK